MGETSSSLKLIIRGLGDSSPDSNSSDKSGDAPKFLKNRIVDQSVFDGDSAVLEAELKQGTVPTV